MSFNNIKTKAQGFTIVELLIVVVVIAILAAITIVSYNGITARANTSKAQANAAAVQKKAEAFNADSSTNTPLQAGNGNYPATAAIFNALASNAVGSLPSGIKLQSLSATSTGSAGSSTAFAVDGSTVAGAPTASNGGSVLQYVACAPTGANNAAADGYFIAYYDYTKSTYVWVGGGQYNTLPGNGAAPTGTNCNATANARYVSTQ